MAGMRCAKRLPLSAMKLHFSLVRNPAPAAGPAAPARGRTGASRGRSATDRLLVGRVDDEPVDGGLRHHPGSGGNSGSSCVINGRKTSGQERSSPADERSSVSPLPSLARWKIARSISPLHRRRGVDDLDTPHEPPGDPVRRRGARNTSSAKLLEITPTPLKSMETVAWLRSRFSITCLIRRPPCREPMSPRASFFTLNTIPPVSSSKQRSTTSYAG